MEEKCAFCQGSLIGTTSLTTYMYLTEKHVILLKFVFENIEFDKELFIGSKLCKVCWNNVRKFHDFKLYFTEIENELKCNNKKLLLATKEQLTLYQALVSIGHLEHSSKIISSSHKACRICFKASPDAEYRDLKKCEPRLSKALMACLPKISMSLTTDANICQICYHKLLNYTFLSRSCKYFINSQPGTEVIVLDSDDDEPLEKRSKLDENESSLTDNTEAQETSRQSPVPEIQENNELLPSKNIPVYGDELHLAYYCKLCSQIVFTLPTLTAHTNMHKSETSFNCNQCSSCSFNTFAAFRKHCVQCHLSSMYEPVKVKRKSLPKDVLESLKTKTTRKRYRRKPLKLLESDIEDISEDQYYQCQCCRGNFKTKAELMEDFELHHENLRTCSICGKVVYSFIALIRHLSKHDVRSVYRIVNYDSEDGPFSSSKEISYSSATNVKTKSNTRLCDIKEKTTIKWVRRKGSYVLPDEATCEDIELNIENINDITEEQYYQCQCCLGTFRTKPELMGDFKRHCKNIRVCRLCGIKFSCFPSLVQHLAIHGIKDLYKTVNYDSEDDSISQKKEISSSSTTNAEAESEELQQYSLKNRKLYHCSHCPFVTFMFAKYEWHLMAEHACSLKDDQGNGHTLENEENVISSESIEFSSLSLEDLVEAEIEEETRHECAVEIRTQSTECASSITCPDCRLSFGSVDDYVDHCCLFRKTSRHPIPLQDIKTEQEIRCGYCSCVFHCFDDLDDHNCSFMVADDVKETTVDENLNSSAPQDLKTATDKFAETSSVSLMKDHTKQPISDSVDAPLISPVKNVESYCHQFFKTVTSSDEHIYNAKTTEPTPLPTLKITTEPTPLRPLKKTTKPTPVSILKKTTKPTPLPTLKRTTEPTPLPTLKRTTEPTPLPTLKITTEPTPLRPLKKTTKPTPVSILKKTTKPTPLPTLKRTTEPTPLPTLKRTTEPTPLPTLKRTTEPTPLPTSKRTTEPTPLPTSKKIVGCLKCQSWFDPPLEHDHLCYGQPGRRNRKPPSEAERRAYNFKKRLRYHFLNQLKPTKWKAFTRGEKMAAISKLDDRLGENLGQVRNGGRTKDLECIGCRLVCINKMELMFHEDYCRAVFRCSRCDYKTSVRLELQQHSLATHKLFYCSYCPFVTLLIEIYEQHLLTKHGCSLMNDPGNYTLENNENVNCTESFEFSSMSFGDLVEAVIEDEISQNRCEDECAVEMSDCDDTFVEEPCSSLATTSELQINDQTVSSTTPSEPERNTKKNVNTFAMSIQTTVPDSSTSTPMNSHIEESEVFVIDSDSDSDTEFVESAETRISSVAVQAEEVCTVTASEASKLISEGIPVVTEANLIMVPNIQASNSGIMNMITDQNLEEISNEMISLTTENNETISADRENHCPTSLDTGIRENGVNNDENSILISDSEDEEDIFTEPQKSDKLKKTVPREKYDQFSRVHVSDGSETNSLDTEVINENLVAGDEVHQILACTFLRNDEGGNTEEIQNDGEKISTEEVSIDPEDDCTFMPQYTTVQAPWVKPAESSANPRKRRPPNSLQIFSSKVIDKIKSEHPNLSKKIRRQIILDTWRDMSETEKLPFKEAARLHKKLFLQENPDLLPPPKHKVKKASVPVFVSEDIEEPVFVSDDIEEPVLVSDDIEEPALVSEDIEEPVLESEDIEEPVLFIRLKRLTFSK